MPPGIIIRTFSSKKGRTVVLRYPREDDFAAAWQFACNLADEDTFVTLTHAPTEEEERKFFTDMMDTMLRKDGVYVVTTVNGEYAGNSRVVRGKNRHAHVGQVGIALAPAYRDEGIGTELMRTLIEQAKKMGLRLVTLTCFENNAKALHLYQKLGFQTAGTIPGEVSWKGGYVGLVHMYLPLM